MYKVIWESSVEKDLAKIDRIKAKKIKDKVENFWQRIRLNMVNPLLVI